MRCEVTSFHVLRFMSSLAHRKFIRTVTRYAVQATYISSLVSSSLYREGVGQSGVMWVIESAQGGGGEGGVNICGANGSPPAMPVGWQNASVIVYVEETLQVETSCEV